MKIFINGCSFTENINGPSWASGFYEKGFTKNQITNLAVGGSSNLLIRRKTFWFLDKIFNTNYKFPDYAIIQWSTIDRWDYPVFVSENRAINFGRMNHHPERINKINYMCNGTDILGYGKNFYENYYSYYGAVVETLEHIYHTQKYLEEKSIPYKMITIGNLFDMDLSIKKLYELQTNNSLTGKGNYASLKTNKNIYEKIEPFEESWFEADILEALLRKIDYTKFLFTDNENISGFGGGIIEWFLNKGETLNGGGHHPSQEQHNRFFSEFLWPNIKNEIYIKNID